MTRAARSASRSGPPGAARSAPDPRRRPRIGAANDPLERHADRLAEHALSTLRRAPPPGAAGSAGPGPVAPASVGAALAQPGAPLEPALRTEMGHRFAHDFSGVRVHTDALAARSASEVGAQAYAVGPQLVFGAGRYAPSTAAGRRLIAHELAHVTQQPGLAQPVLRRTLTEAQLATTPETTIRSDPDYLDNRLTRVEFYTAELAILHYEDGASFRLGLVPDQITAPVEGVDYRTRRSEHAVITPSPAGETRFVPRAAQIRAPGMSFGDVIREFGRTVTYRLDAASHRIVPTEVNDVTAPRLCEVLRRAEAEYVRNTDAMARGMVEALQVLEVALIIASFLPTGGESAAAAGTRGAAATAEVGLASRAVAALRSFFLRLLRSGGSEAITVEGVAFGGVRVAMSEGRVLTVLRDAIVNVERVAGQGRLMHSAFEQAAVAAAREAGATSVRVGVQTVVNARWAAYLESLGYTWELVPTATGFSRVLIRTLTL